MMNTHPVSQILSCRRLLQLSSSRKAATKEDAWAQGPRIADDIDDMICCKGLSHKFVNFLGTPRPLHLLLVRVLLLIPNATALVILGTKNLPLDPKP